MSTIALAEQSLNQRRLGRRTLTTVVVVFATIGVLSAVGRLISIALSLNAGHVEPDNPDAHYVHHLAPILLHLIPGLLFCVLGPVQLSHKARARWPRAHRIGGRIFVLAAVICGVTSLWMNLTFPAVGGPGKYVSNLVFGSMLVAGPLIALVAVLRGDLRRHRAWMIRTVAVGLGVASQRLILFPYLLVGGELTTRAIDVGVIAGWVLNLLVAEWIVRRVR